MTTLDGFTCQSCGEFHEGLARCLPTKCPTYYQMVPESERSERCWLSNDLCVIDDRDFFIYGSLEIPIHDHPDPFIWGVWVSISKTDFMRSQDLFGVVGRETERPYPGWLSTDIPFYPSCLELVATVHTQRAGIRPLIELQTLDHPLVCEHKDGITPRRVQEIVEWFLHGRFEQ